MLANGSILSKVETLTAEIEIIILVSTYIVESGVTSIVFYM
jgi:hypothetical protein